MVTTATVPAAMVAPRRAAGRTHRRTERGNAAPVVLAAVALAAVLAVGVARASTAAERRARADATADLVALAGVTGGPADAAEVADRNGASIARFAVVGDPVTGTVVVDVDRDGQSARSAAAPAGS